MNFNEPEVLEIGEARELIQETLIPDAEESLMGQRTRNGVAIYVAE